MLDRNRTNPRRLRRSGFIVALLLATPVSLAGNVGIAATFHVNSKSDAGDASPGDGNCWTGAFIPLLSDPLFFTAECTLRAAIEEANGLPGFDAIEFLHNIALVATVVEFLPATPLPLIHDPVLIDGYSHPTYDGAAANPTPVINILGGSTTGTTNGLVFIPGSDGSTVRGLAITNFPGSGILISQFFSPGPQGIRLEGNHLGINRGVFYTGNGLDGVTIANADANTIGQGCTFLIGCLGRRNLIAANGRSGVRITGTGNRVAGNYIGVDRFGNSTFVPFGGSTRNVEYGIHVLSGSGANEIGSVGAIFDLFTGESNPVASGNLVSGNLLGGIRVESPGSTVLGNLVGTNAAGTSALPNQAAGIEILGANNVVGAVGVGSNLVSGNTGGGIVVSDPDLSVDGVQIVGNRVGVVGTGDAPLGNGVNGISVDGDNHVMSDNLIGGNASFGIRDSGNYSLIERNFIGTNASGQDLGNGLAGLEIIDGGAQVGGPGAGNTIGFNDRGISGTSSSFNVSIQGNFIGTNAAGANLANDRQGILISGAGYDVGGASGRTNGLANTVGFSGGAGIHTTSAAFLVEIKSNYVGTDVADRSLGNTGPGIQIDSPTQVGASLADPPVDVSADGNIVAYNAEGVFVSAGIEHTLRGNLFWENGGLPIDLGPVGPETNDFGDVDTGVNRLQNSPVFDAALTQYLAGTGDVEVRYLVDSAPAVAAYPITVDFYVYDPWLEPGDQARVYIGTDSYPAASASSFRTATISPPPGALVPNGLGFVFEGLRATATDADGNTSELSIQNVPVPEPSSYALWTAGVAGLVVLCRRRPRADARQ